MVMPDYDVAPNRSPAATHQRNVSSDNDRLHGAYSGYSIMSPLEAVEACPRRNHKGLNSNFMGIVRAGNPS
jgi:hypothetical protein